MYDSFTLKKEKCLKQGENIAKKFHKNKNILFASENPESISPGWFCQSIMVEWVLVLLLEKSDIELKPKPKSNLLRCKNIVNIATFNIKTLNTIN